MLLRITPRAMTVVIVLVLVSYMLLEAGVR